MADLWNTNKVIAVLADTLVSTEGCQIISNRNADSTKIYLNIKDSNSHFPHQSILFKMADTIWRGCSGRRGVIIDHWEYWTQNQVSPTRHSYLYKEDIRINVHDVLAISSYGNVDIIVSNGMLSVDIFSLCCRISIYFFVLESSGHAQLRGWNQYSLPFNVPILTNLLMYNHRHLVRLLRGVIGCSICVFPIAIYRSVEAICLTRWGLHRMDGIMQTTFSD